MTSMENRKSPPSVLVVDDQQSFCFMVKGFLDDAGYVARYATGGVEALELLSREAVDLVLSDLVMADLDGMALLREVRRRYPDTPFVLTTAYGSIDTAVAAMKQGADDYLLKPLRRDELLLTVERSLHSIRLQQDHDSPGGFFRELYSFQNIKTVSAVMAKVLSAAEKVAAFPQTTIAIYGESGAGKEVLARAIHAASGSSPATFIPVNCAAIPESLLESELFGHVKGAFTGAEYERTGKCRQAGGGTLFLDEIGDMPLTLQAKLLRVLEEKVFASVGSDDQQVADFRVMVATHQDLRKLSEQGRFRTDLYYRLNVIPLVIPPLRERKGDIPYLADYFLGEFCRHQGKNLSRLSRAAFTALLAYDWPGNVRELRNRLEYAAIMAKGTSIQSEDLLLHSPFPPTEATGIETITLHFEFTAKEFSYDQVIARLKNWALRRSNNNKSAAARLLKTSRKLFY
jgi:two-component system, NtrC family, response regulator AtoC